MIINKVTITGADNNTDISYLKELSIKYPFVEWGILFSPKRIGVDRYPSYEWVQNLKFLTNVNLSAHVCGTYTYDLLEGNDKFFHIYDDIKDVFSRVQLNFNITKAKVNLPSFLSYLKYYNEKYKWNFIFQMNDNNKKLIENALLPYSHNVDYFNYLFDGSGGNGKLGEWTEPLANSYCGYAGGLAPENLEEQLELIDTKVGDNTIWIDTETGVRTNDKLDLDKVDKFLNIASKYIK